MIDHNSTIEEVLSAVRINGHFLYHASPDLRANKNVVLAAVQQNGLSLQYASHDLQADREVVLAAVQQNGLSLQYAVPAFQTDREIVLTALHQHNNLEHVPAFQGDKEVVLAVVSRRGFSLEHASPALRADRDVVLAAVQQNGQCLQYASSALRADREMVLTSLHLEYAPAFQDDKEVVLAVVSRRGFSLEHASPALRADRDVVLAAVQQNGHCLQYASPALRSYREMVLALVKRDGWYLQYASPAEIVLAAIWGCDLKLISPALLAEIDKYKKSHNYEPEQALIAMISQEKDHQAYTAAATNSVIPLKKSGSPFLPLVLSGYIGSFLTATEGGLLARTHRTAANDAHQARHQVRKKTVSGLTGIAPELTDLIFDYNAECSSKKIISPLKEDHAHGMGLFKSPFNSVQYKPQDYGSSSSSSSSCALHKKRILPFIARQTLLASEGQGPQFWKGSTPKDNHIQYKYLKLTDDQNHRSNIDSASMVHVKP